MRRRDLRGQRGRVEDMMLQKIASESVPAAASLPVHRRRLDEGAVVSIGCDQPGLRAKFGRHVGQCHALLHRQGGSPRRCIRTA